MKRFYDADVGTRAVAKAIKLAQCSPELAGMIVPVVDYGFYQGVYNGTPVEYIYALVRLLHYG